MSNSISSISNSVPEIEPVAQNAKSVKPSNTAAPQQGKDTVQLSSGGKAALQELSETPAQTAKEASGGDAQAKRLLAKEHH
jgi:hypothetical protein